jgi:multiple sugar transport system permease protein
MRYRTQLLIMLAPFLVGLTALVIVPAVGSLTVAFLDYSPLEPFRFDWVGLEKFIQIKNDPLFWTALGNSLLYTVVSVPLRMVGILGLALFLEKRHKGIGFYRSSAYLPTIIPDVAYSLIWLWLVNPTFGPINELLRTLHLPTQSWLIDTGGARGIVIAMGVLQIGEGIVIMLAALRDISPDLYDVARMDGAGWWMRLRTLVLPLIAPTFVLLLFRTTIVSLQDNFAPALILTEGGPHYATYFLPYKIYVDTFQNFRFGYGSAMIWVVYAASLLIVLLQHIATRRWSNAAYV